MPLLSLVSRLSNATPNFGDISSFSRLVKMNLAFDEKATKGLYAEVTEGNRTYFECSICFHKLSRLQRIESHLTLVHGKGESLNIQFEIFLKSSYSMSRRRHGDVNCNNPEIVICDLSFKILTDSVRKV